MPGCCFESIFVSYFLVVDGASDYSSQSSSYSRQSSYAALSRLGSSSVELTPSPQPVLSRQATEFCYLPQISIESEGGYCASSSCQSSLEACAAGEVDINRLGLNRSFPQLASSSVEGLLSSPSSKSASSLQSMKSDSLPSSSAFTRKPVLRRKTAARGYRSSFTLQVPRINLDGGDTGDEEPCSCKPRRASFDDVFMSEYHLRKERDLNFKWVLMWWKGIVSDQGVVESGLQRMDSYQGVVSYWEVAGYPGGVKKESLAI